jgi:hypothetical protein
MMRSVSMSSPRTGTAVPEACSMREDLVVMSE